MTVHVPVLLTQVVSWLQPERGGLFVDCTVGLGGHGQALLAAGADRLIGLDRDADALAQARTRLASWGTRVVLVHADFRDLPGVLDREDAGPVAGVLADLGVSSLQLDAAGRGFSFRRDEPLDMRMDRSSGPDAATWLRDVAEDELAGVLSRYGEERFARRIARLIVRERAERPIATTGQLAAIVRRAVPLRGPRRIDPATRTFQAIRIAVNRELERLDAFLPAALRRLAPGGRLGVIAFHSLEDRVVKHTLRAVEHDGDVPIRVLTRKPVVPDDDEVAANPRARSAKLRVAEKTR
jgi:16S rRNA (cytosine1402-N4)-methyltransferase